MTIRIVHRLVLALALATAAVLLAGCSWSTASGPDSGESGVTHGPGSAIAYVATLGKHDTNLFVVPAAGSGGPVRITRGSAHVIDAAWNPQGTEVVYSRQYLRGALGGDSIDQIRVYVQRPGGAPRMIRRCVVTCWAQGFAWSPDGRRIAFVTDVKTTHGGYGEIAAMNADGSGFHVVCGMARCGEGLEDPQWSPDGTRLIYSNAQQIDAFGALGGGVPESHIWVSTSRGTHLRMLTTGCTPEMGGSAKCFYDASARWSPNGRWIAFSRLAGGPSLTHVKWRTSLELVRSDGKSLHTPASCTGSFCNEALAPAWSPDGSTIAYVPSERAPAIGLVTLRGVRTRVRTCGAPGHCVIPGAPVWSPDGTALAFVNQVPESSLFTIGADGAGMRPVAANASGDLAWLDRSD